MASNLNGAKKAQKDEFYTFFPDIQKEVNAYLEYNPDVFRNKTILLPCDDPEWSNFTKFFAQNFENFGLKKLISTSFAVESKKYKSDWQPTLFETENPLFNLDKSKRCGKIFVLDHDTNANGKIDIDDLQWQYLEGDGDFRSDEVKRLRDEADIIVTNPPFSLFREFLSWVLDANKLFLIIGNVNDIPLKNFFPLIMENRIWTGVTTFNDGVYFKVPKDWCYEKSYKYLKEMDGVPVNRVSSVCWYTNIDHGRRHRPLDLMTAADNIKFSNIKEVRNFGYLHYDDFDAINIPEYSTIPSDYDGIMGVPITFIDKYCPEQYEILGCYEPCIRLEEYRKMPNFKEYKSRQKMYGGVLCQKTYHRIFIRKKK